MNCPKEIFLSQDPSTPPDVLNGLLDNSKPIPNYDPFCDHHIWHLWYNISVNPNTPAEALNKLADLCFKSNFYVLMSKIQNHPNAARHTKQFLHSLFYLDTYL